MRQKRLADSWSAPTRWLVACSLVSLCSGARDSVLGVAWPGMRAAFGVPLDALGALVAAITVGYVATTMASIVVARRIPRAQLIAAAAAASAMGLLAGASAGTWLGILVTFSAAGLAAGLMDATLNAHTALREGPRGMHLLYASYGIGAVLGPVALGTAFTRGHSWREAYVALGIAMLVASGLFAVSGGTAATLPHARDEARGRSATRGAVFSAALPLFAVCSGLELAVGVWAFTLLLDGRGYSALVAGAAASVYWTGIIASRAFLALQRRPVQSTCLIRSGLLAFSAGIALLAVGRSPVVDLLALFLAGIGAGPVLPALMGSTVERAGEGAASTAIALQISAATLGQGVVPALAGYASRLLGLRGIPVAFLICAGVGFLLHEALAQALAQPTRRPA